VYDFCIFVCMKTTRTNIELRDDLIKDIMKFGEAKSKREAVEKALEMYVSWLKRQKLRSLRGKVEWDGDLMEMRKGRVHDI
jgi:Transcription regulator of the Arc/MetJ class